MIRAQRQAAAPAIEQQILEGADVLVDAVCGMQLSGLPEIAHASGLTVFMDTFGVTAGARNQAIAAKLRRYLALNAEPGQSTSICDHEAISAAAAAFTNGSLSHDLEIDDIHQGTSIHVAAVLVPVALAVGEEVDATYDDVLLALTRGYEVTCRMGYLFDTEQMYVVGFHPTAVCGAIGAAVTAGSLLSFSKDELLDALYLATNLSSGLMACKTEVDHYTKSFQCGVAARHGVLSAEAVRSGAYDRNDLAKAFLAAVMSYSGGSPRPEMLTNDLGSSFEIAKTSFKLYPCCSHIHPLLDALAEIRTKAPVPAADIRKVQLRLYPRGAVNVGDHTLLTHNARYAMAMALQHAVLERPFFTEEYGIDPVRPLMDRIELYGDPDLDRFWPAAAPGIVTIEMNDGKIYSERVDYRKGTPENRLTWDDMRTKFVAVMKPVVGDETAQELAELMASKNFRIRTLMQLSKRAENA